MCPIRSPHRTLGILATESTRAVDRTRSLRPRRTPENRGGGLLGRLQKKFGHKIWGVGKKFGPGPTSKKWPKFVRTCAKNPKKIPFFFQMTLHDKQGFGGVIENSRRPLKRARSHQHEKNGNLWKLSHVITGGSIYASRTSICSLPPPLPAGDVKGCGSRQPFACITFVVEIQL